MISSNDWILKKMTKWKYLPHDFLKHVVVILSPIHTLHLDGEKIIRVSARTAMKSKEWNIS